jgi:DNA repair exonuclease SbcCD ATPase subunit
MIKFRLAAGPLKGVNALDIDPDLWLLSFFAVGLLAAGGAALRSLVIHPVSASSAHPAGPTSHGDVSPHPEHRPAPVALTTSGVSAVAPPPEEPVSATLDDIEQPARAAEELAAVREQLSRSEVAREALRIETIEQRQRAERLAQAAQAEIQRLTRELESEKTRVQENRVDFERRLDEAGQALEAARARIEALERLMEGVRARSRELAAELAASKRAGA